jgi:hypothetical protein
MLWKSAMSIWQPPERYFKVTKPSNPWIVGKTDWINPLQEQLSAEWKDDENLKQQYGIELAKSNRPFEAAKLVFQTNVQVALWVSQNWINDPIVIAAKDLYQKTIEKEQNLLDKDALALKLLSLADEKTPDGRFFVHDAKDRIATLKLYAEVQGYIGKIDINTSTNFVNNAMKIVLVKPNNKEEEKIVKTIEHEDVQIDKLPVKIKLVG